MTNNMQRLGEGNIPVPFEINEFDLEEISRLNDKREVAEEIFKEANNRVWAFARSILPPNVKRAPARLDLDNGLIHFTGVGEETHAKLFRY